MKILFITLAKFNSLTGRSIYEDLLRKFHEEKHSIYILSPIERRFNQKTSLYKEERISLLKVRTPNIQKTNIFEKGFGTLILEILFKKALNKHFKNEKFDLIMYSTPPITLTRLVKSLKKENSAKTYLLLKDIFPQNAVDLKIFSNSSLIYKYFRKKEIELYNMSDWIGCMSNENKKYILKHNSYLKADRIEVNPNSIYLEEETYTKNDNHELLSKVPKDKVIFVYGGNLGKPQGVEFLLDVIINSKHNPKAFFIIVGSGTEQHKLFYWFKKNKPLNALFIKELKQSDYDTLLQYCDIGLVFLHPDFTIPNYPSRILPYMKNKLPIIFATDVNTDVGKEAELFKYGFWCKSGNLEKILSLIDHLTYNEELRITMGTNGYNRLKKDFNVNHSYKLIMNHFRD